jgi:hypothetical protein
MWTTNFTDDVTNSTQLHYPFSFVYIIPANIISDVRGMATLTSFIRQTQTFSATCNDISRKDTNMKIWVKTDEV